MIPPEDKMSHYGIPSGVIAELVTPHTLKGGFCEKSAFQLVDYTRSNGCMGAYVGGPLGGLDSVNAETRISMMRAACTTGQEVIFNVTHVDPDTERALASSAETTVPEYVALSIDRNTWNSEAEAAIERLAAVFGRACHSRILLALNDDGWPSASCFASVCNTKLIHGVIAETNDRTRYEQMIRWARMFGLYDTLFWSGDHLITTLGVRGLSRLISRAACVYPQRAVRSIGGLQNARECAYYRRAASYDLPTAHAVLYKKDVLLSPVPPPAFEVLDEAAIGGIAEQWYLSKTGES